MRSSLPLGTQLWVVVSSNLRLFGARNSGNGTVKIHSIHLCDTTKTHNPIMVFKKVKVREFNHFLEAFCGFSFTDNGE